MKNVHIRLYGERALFRNMAIPGTDVAAGHEIIQGRRRAIHGILGNMLGLWRNFDDSNHFGLAPELVQWIEKHELEIQQIQYPKDPEIRILGQHRYKTTHLFTKAGESGPKPITYHWDVKMDVWVKVSDKGAHELKKALRRPVGTPYLGQSNCPAQVFLMEDSDEPERSGPKPSPS